MNRLFGANWQTTLWGYITLTAGAITFAPGAVAFLPDDVEGYVKGVSGLITLVSGGVFVSKVKDKNVTGGTVQQTADGSVASHLDQSASSSVTETKQAEPKQ